MNRIIRSNLESPLDWYEVKKGVFDYQKGGFSNTGWAHKIKFIARVTWTRSIFLVKTIALIIFAHRHNVA